jgi:carbon storage regulator
MLVLTRKTQEEIIIGDDIRLTVLEVRGGRVKLAVTAPDNVAIRRKEVAAQIGRDSSPTRSP